MSRRRRLTPEGAPGRGTWLTEAFLTRIGKFGPGAHQALGQGQMPCRTFVSCLVSQSRTSVGSSQHNSAAPAVVGSKEPGRLPRRKPGKEGRPAGPSQNGPPDTRPRSTAAAGPASLATSGRIPRLRRGAPPPRNRLAAGEPLHRRLLERHRTRSPLLAPAWAASAAAVASARLRCPATVQRGISFSGKQPVLGPNPRGQGADHHASCVIGGSRPPPDLPIQLLTRRVPRLGLSRHSRERDPRSRW